MISFLKRSTNEESIITGLRSAGSERRLWEKKLYESYFYLINHGARKYRISEDDAASVYSDTIISVIENIVSHRFEGRSSLKSFTYQIFINKCVDVVRKNTTNKSTVNNNAVMVDSLVMSLPDTSRNIVQKLIEQSDQFELRQKLKELGEKCRQVLMLFEDGYTDREISTAMNYNSAEVVKTTRLRCLEKLREKIIAKKV